MKPLKADMSSISIGHFYLGTEQCATLIDIERTFFPYKRRDPEVFTNSLHPTSRKDTNNKKIMKAGIGKLCLAIMSSEKSCLALLHHVLLLLGLMQIINGDAPYLKIGFLSLAQ